MDSNILRFTFITNYSCSLGKISILKEMCQPSEQLIHFSKRQKSTSAEKRAARKHAYIMLTPLNPTFIKVKLGFTGVYIIVLIYAQKHRLWVLIRTASLRQF